MNLSLFCGNNIIYKYLYIISYTVGFFKEFLIFIGEKMNFFKSSFFLLAIGGLISGFVNGLLGAGGGIIIVFILSKLIKDEATPRDIFANALCIMLPLSLVSCIIYALNGSINFGGALPFFIPAIAGGTIGGILLSKINTELLKKLFAALVAISGILMIAK